ncbi:dimethylaniline monooxygenase [Schizopora paradoxa]|uniref:Dimethylaniline monooxygenase n=1 Tax=Schizopora paradoxa TaxID=27342 RepID=A0A0H2S508_9AGAM|nr:dimethylaniline monooxygenase [Schizopora paradoxa]
MPNYEELSNIRGVAQDWLDSFRLAVYSGDADAFVNCMAADGWFRDLLTFSWEFKTMKGRDATKAYLCQELASAKISNIDFDDENPPSIGHFGPRRRLVDVGFTFETPRAYGQGYVRINFPVNSSVDGPDDGDRKAFGLLLMLKDWKGYEESKYESGISDREALYWEEIEKKRRNEIEEDPSALIIGGGQTGLNVAARFRQMNIKAIIVEKNARVGDNWRKRYPTLALHTPRIHHNFLYEPFPSNWPKYTPKERLANWMEQYALTQDLVVWLKSTVEGHPVYNSETGKWDVTVNKNGGRMTLHPSHIVIATSMYGKPIIPSLEGLDLFRGQILHSSEYHGGSPFANKSVVVVGSGNSSADVCQDLVFRGASSVTMVQRSASGVVSEKLMGAGLAANFPEGRRVERSDLSAAATPIVAVRQLMQETRHYRLDFDKEMLDGLRKVGFNVTDGNDNAGVPLMVYARGGVIDVGCAPLIIEGRVKVKQGVGISKLTESTIVFEDGTILEADAIIFATGWVSIREDLKEVFGEEAIQKTSEIWGIGEDGEIHAGYNFSGQPGLWYTWGGFNHSRFYSKHLALFIKAIELGYFNYGQ